MMQHKAQHSVTCVYCRSQWEYEDTPGMRLLLLFKLEVFFLQTPVECFAVALHSVRCRNAFDGQWWAERYLRPMANAEHTEWANHVLHIRTICQLDVVKHGTGQRRLGIWASIVGEDNWGTALFNPVSM